MYFCTNNNSCSKTRYRYPANQPDKLRKRILFFLKKRVLPIRICLMLAQKQTGQPENPAFTSCSHSVSISVT